MNKFLVLLNKFKDCFTSCLPVRQAFAMTIKLNVIARRCPEPVEGAFHPKQSVNIYQKIYTKVFIIIFFQLFLCLGISNAQRIPDKIIDTFLISTGKIVLYENNKWEYLEEISKDTVKHVSDKNYFDSEMLINQGKTPYIKSKDKGKKRRIELAEMKNNKNSKNDNETINKNNAVYSIKKGDTLMDIARKYGTTVNKLCALNKLTKTSKLSIGQKIKVK